MTEQGADQVSICDTSTGLRKYIAKIVGGQSLMKKYGNDRQRDQEFGFQIGEMYQRTYCRNLIFLSHEIEFHRKGQCLKRFYHAEEYMAKIEMLSDYYKFHKELPALFDRDFYEILDQYNEDQRNLEYETVKEKIQADQKVQAQQQPRPTKPHTEMVQTKKLKQSQKLLRNIHLSYANFQNKKAKSKPTNSFKENNAQKNQKNKKRQVLKCETIQRNINSLFGNKKSTFKTHQKYIGRQSQQQSKESSRSKPKETTSLNNTLKRIERSKSQSNLLQKYKSQKTLQTTITLKKYNEPFNVHKCQKDAKEQQAVQKNEEKKLTKRSQSKKVITIKSNQKTSSTKKTISCLDRYKKSVKVFEISPKDLGLLQEIQPVKNQKKGSNNQRTSQNKKRSTSKVRGSSDSREKQNYGSTQNFHIAGRQKKGQIGMREPLKSYDCNLLQKPEQITRNGNKGSITMFERVRQSKKRFC